MLILPPRCGRALIPPKPNAAAALSCLRRPLGAEPARSAITKPEPTSHSAITALNCGKSQLFNDDRASQHALPCFLLVNLKLIPPPRARLLNLFAWVSQRRSPVASKPSSRRPERLPKPRVILLCSRFDDLNMVADGSSCFLFRKNHPDKTPKARTCSLATRAKMKTRPRPVSSC